MSANLTVGNVGESNDKPLPPNVKLAHGQLPITVDGFVNIGLTPPMFLPSEAEQRRGFHVEHPEVLVTQYFPRYKYFAGRVPLQTLQEIARDDMTRTAVQSDPIDRLADAAESDPEFKAANGGDASGNS